MQHSIIIQNADVNATSKDYAHLQPNELLVHGYFSTIQGEGPFTGHPAFFIRLGGCNFGAKNVACAACDTAFHLSKSKPMSFDDLKRAYLDNLQMTPLMVVTGGEPCLQPNLGAFVSYVRHNLPWVTVQIETNGSKASNMLDCMSAGAFIVCSPKTVGGRYAAAPFLPKTDPKSTPTSRLVPCFVYKFVLTAREDDAHHKLPAWVHQVPPSLVYVSPCTVYAKPYIGEVSSAWDPTQIDQAQTAANYAYAASVAIDNGFNLSVQTHTFLSIP